MDKISIYSLTLENLEIKCLEFGMKKHNAKQIFKWIYDKNITDFDQMSDISKPGIISLKNNFYFGQLKEVSKLIDPDDETTKFLFELEGGQNIETVLMKFNYGYSICASSQIGCNMGCKFCASGLLKKIRDLRADEIVLQLITVNKYLHDLNGEKISNMVVMGIGEPFENYENLKTALLIINNSFGIGLGARRITVSTSGVVPKITEFAKDFPQLNLAISLHAPNDVVRSKIMPINNKWNIESLMNALRKYSEMVNRKITFEYLLLNGVNDSKECAFELTKLVRNLNCYVNLIIYNSVSEHGFKRSTNLEEFARVLISKGINTTTRLERGTKIDAACGQLRAKYEKKL